MHKVLYICIVLTLCCSILFASKVDKNRPAWVDNPTAEYNNQLYLSAVGSASTRAQAEDNARANLAKIFSTTITTESGFEQRYQEIISGSDASFTTETNQTDKIQIQSSQKLTNIQIGKTWTDKLGQVYAIAYLHRHGTAELYLQQIGDNSKRIMTLLSQSTEGDSWVIFACLTAAGIVDAVNADLIEQLKVISLSDASDLVLPYDREILRKQIQTAGQKITFRIVMNGDEIEKIKPQIETAITSLGFAVSEIGVNRVLCNTTFEDLLMDSQQKYVRYQCTIAVSDESEQQIVTMSEIGREAHFTYDEAKARAIRSISAKIKGDFSKKLQNYLDSRAKAR